MVAVAIFNFPSRTVRELALALLLASVLATAIALSAVVATALMPLVTACCVAALPVVGKLVVGATIIAVYTFASKKVMKL